MWSGQPGSFIRPKKRASRPKRNLERRSARRAVLPGYPIDPKHMTLEEVRHYFSGDKIVCFQCGKSYKRLAGHLRAVHSITEDDYRTLYGLPLTRGLLCEPSRAAYAEAFARNADSLREARSGLPDPLEKARMTPHRKSPFKENTCSGNLSSAANWVPQYPDSTFEEFLRRVATGRTVHSVIGDSDMPGYKWFRTRWTNNPSLRAKLMMILDGLPFGVQAKNGMGMGARFVAEVTRLRKLGLSDKKIAAAVGLTAMSVHDCRRKHGIK